jgi:hypothetical protein
MRLDLVDEEAGELLAGPDLTLHLGERGREPGAGERVARLRLGGLLSDRGLLDRRVLQLGGLVTGRRLEVDLREVGELDVDPSAHERIGPDPEGAGDQDHRRRLEDGA